MKADSRLASPGFRVNDATGSKPFTAGNVERRSRGTRRIKIMLRFLMVRCCGSAVSEGVFYEQSIGWTYA